MKKNIRLITNKGEVLKEGQVEIRNQIHFEVQLQNRKSFTKNKKAYDRKKSKSELRKITISY